MKTHYGVTWIEAACENAESGDHADTDVRDVDCEACWEIRERYLREALTRVETRLATLRKR